MISPRVFTGGDLATNGYVLEGREGAICFDAPEGMARELTRSGIKPAGSLAKEIDKAFGAFDEFKKQFTEAAVAQFGSGWAWVVTDGKGFSNFWGGGPSTLSEGNSQRLFIRKGEVRNLAVNAVVSGESDPVQTRTISRLELTVLASPQ